MEVHRTYDGTTIKDQRYNVEQQTIMAKVTGGILKNVEGHLGDITVYKRGGKTFVRPSHIHQPHRLSRKQLALREQIAHNNNLWRKLKETHHTYFEGGVDAYRRFMSVNTISPTVYLTKEQLSGNTSLLLPDMAVSDGPLNPISYQFDEVDGQSALFTNLTPKDIRKGDYLLYVLQQKVGHCQYGEDLPHLKISVVPVTPDQDIMIQKLGTISLVNVPSTLLTPVQSKDGTIALVGEIFSNPMLGFALVRMKDGHVSPQRVISRCTYYERYTTEEALQTAAKSYNGLTGE